jgi:hypothetical protein
MNELKWKIPTVEEIHRQNAANRVRNMTFKGLRDGNNWRDIKKARKAKAGASPFRVWLTGFVWGVVTLAIMSGLTWLAWRAF